MNKYLTFEVALDELNKARRQIASLETQIRDLKNEIYDLGSARILWTRFFLDSTSPRPKTE